MPLAYRLLLVITLTLAVGTPCRAADEQPIDFGRQILPILSDHCYQCHGPDAKQRQADLRLDDEANAKQARDGAAAIVPGRSDDSELYRRIIALDPDERMPPADSNRPLSAVQINLLKRWIDQGAPWGGHWSWQRLSRPALPAAAFADRAQNAIDTFVFARLNREGLAPSPEAHRETLLRRVSLDLTGLPPTPVEVDSFLSDTSPDAYLRHVDRLLASPAFGERMAWDWLDAARYADSNGYQGDGERTMYPWRDWVVQAFNRNLPYDQFTVWQLAGDLLPAATDEQKLATGFCRNHSINGEGGRIPEENRVDYVMDMTETLGTVWLGMTLNCCRCHDHKFDAVAQRDYYSLLAFFNQTPVDGGGGNPQTPPVIEMPSDEQKARLPQLVANIDQAAAALDAFETNFFPRSAAGQTADESEKAASLPDAIKTIIKLPARQRNRDQLEQLKKHWEKESPEYLAHLQKLHSAIDARDALSRSIARVMVMADLPQLRQTFILDKGLYDKPRDAVTAAVPARLPPLAAGAPANRLGLAQWLVSPENPLTARVTVNRLWQQFFGIGLVKTPEDFGVQGERPVHPELLDWLAAELMASGWDIKHLCRLIVTSAVYRRSSAVTAALSERDPENRLLARGPRFRMPSWMVRDQALAAAGLLVGRIGGPPVNPYQPGDLWADITFDRKHFQQDHGEALYRRSLYTFWRRIVAPSLFFDSASRQVCTVKHLRTNSPLHALTTLNDVTYIEAARAIAQRVLVAGPTDPAVRITSIFRLVLARPPGGEELNVLKASVERLKREFSSQPEAVNKFLAVGESKRDESLDPVEHAAYTALASAVLNLDEALNKE